MPALLRALRTSLPAQPLTAAAVLQYLGGGGRSASGVDVNPQTAMRHMAVLRAIELTAGTVAGLPLKIYRDSGGMREEVKSDLFLDPMHAELDITWFEGIEFIVSTVMRFGNSCSLIIRNEGGDRIVRLLPLPAEVVERIWRGPDPAGGRGPVKLIKIVGIEEPLTSAEVLHIPGISWDGICGMSPLDAAREAIGIGLAAEEVAGRLYDSGLLHGGFLKALGPATEAQVGLAKQRWKDKVGGLVRAYEVAVLSEGWDFVPNTIPPKDAQFIESRQFSVAEIARLYGMPPSLLFEYMGTGNVDAEKMGDQWVRFGLGQFLERLEDRLSLHLLPAGEFCEFLPEGLLRGTTIEQAKAMSLEIDAGMLTTDEARAIKNRAPIEDPAPLPLLELVNAATALIRAGFDPAAALVTVGLPPTTHLGLLPITLKSEDQIGAEADAAVAAVDDPTAGEDPSAP